MNPTPDKLPDGRIEPHLDWHSPPDGGASPPILPPRSSRPRWVWLLGLLIAVGLVTVVVLRKPIANHMWQASRVQALLDQGEMALQQGKLSASDGSGARQRFEAALALDGDRSEARAGLARVGDAAIRQARAALKADELDKARQALLLARDLQVPQAQSDAIDRELRQRGANAAGIGSLIAQAMAAREAGNIDGTPESALPLLQRILALQSDNTIALEAREDLLSDQLQQARHELQAGKLVEGARRIARVRELDPGHYDLPAVSAQLTNTLDQRRQAADVDQKGGRLERAVTGYQTVLSVNPDDAAANQGLQNTAARYAQRARRSAADFHFDEATADLERARALWPQSDVVEEAAQAIDRARRNRSRLSNAAPPSPQRQRRLKALLAEANKAESRGRWIDPPGESAFDKLRAAQALAPDDAAVRKSLQRLLPNVQRCLTQELSANRVRAAQACFDAWQTIWPDDDGLPHARRQLAMRWIDIGTERLGAGELSVASEALKHAQALDRDAPGLSDFAARVARAQAGGG